MSDLTQRTIYEHMAALRNKEYSSEELTRAYLSRIEAVDSTIGAFITVTPEKALSCAKAFDEGKASDSPLAGIPCGIKDNICTKGIKTTCASRMLENYIAPYNAHVMEKLEQSGAVILGKMNMDEFAMGSTTENSALRVCRNPVDTDRIPGGSSGGSAAAVAAKEAAYTLGSDTGGSIRQPAAFCGVVGMKPTYGSVSRYGLVAFASSLDQIGPITSTVMDNAIVLNAIVGHDQRDATSISRSYGDFTADIQKGVKGLRIGIPKQFFGEGIAEDVKSAVLAATEEYRMMGAELVPVSMPSIDYALSAYYVISSAEASSNLARFDGIRYGYRCEEYNDIEELYKKSRSEGFGKEVKKRIMLGTFALSSGYYDAYYKKALQVRNLVRQDFANVFEQCDCMISPVAPTVAYKLGEKVGDSLQMYMGDAYSVPINIAGIPALSLPCGKGEGGMPVGMQLIGPAFSESLLYRVGYAFETKGK